MHTLLACSADGVSLPAALAGFTDKPQGHLGPGEVWWPSVGCGPVDEWWAVWWSVPDNAAARAGMARAEVALWPIDDVAHIGDLAKIMAALNGGTPIPAASPEVLAAVAEALVASDQLPVFPDLAMWPGVLAGLWPRLWPAARREFAAWVVLSPPQVGDVKFTPWLYGVPAGRENQWPSRVVIHPSELTTASRGARWLMGERDATIDELLAECPFPDGSLTHLKRIARAAQSLDRVRSTQDMASGIELARTLAAIAPHSDGARRLKVEALEAVSKGLAKASVAEVRTLANLNATRYPANALPSIALQQWVSDRLPSQTSDAREGLLKTFVGGSAETWWLDAFGSGVRAGLGSMLPAWWQFALFWLCKKFGVSVLRGLMADPARGEVEVVSAADGVEVGGDELQALRLASRELGWSRLHALAVWRLYPPSEAFAEQLRFPADPVAGVDFLVARTRDEDLVSCAVSLQEPRLLEAAAERTVRTPSLLRVMDLSTAGWRRLWAEHLANGGAAWSDGVDRTEQIRRFLDAVAAGSYVSGPISRLASAFAAEVLSQSSRQKVWLCMEPHEAALLAQEAAKIVIEKLANGESIAKPEQPVVDAIVAQAGRLPLGAGAIVAVVAWNPTTPERTVREWVRRASCEGEPGRQLGRLILDRRWKDIAEDLFSRYRQGELDVLTALSECRSILKWWNQARVPMNTSDGPTALTRDDLIRRAGELGGDLAPLSLDYMWVRAGGSVKMLPVYGTPAERWYSAARSADSGVLSGGLLALVDVLLVEYRHSTELAELRRELERDRYSRF